jgi:3-deoxy-D-manno-octulosonic-acid transferase
VGCKKSFAILANQPPLGLLARAYLLASPLIGLVAPMILRQRLKQGREDASRWREKLGEPGAARPKGRLIWLHAVGIGEVMALRGFIAALSRLDPQAHFLITSSARSSAQVIAGNLPDRTIHQYLPLDAPSYLARFLEHWRPALSIWAEQDLWPGAVLACRKRGIPLALINARMDKASLEKRLKIKSLYGDLYVQFQLISAQDRATAGHLALLGALSVQVDGSLKSAAPPLRADPQDLAQMRGVLDGRLVWVAASTHPEDEAVALSAQAQLWSEDPRWLLILVPRVPARAAQIKTALPMARRTLGDLPGRDTAVYLADSFGELGLWYRLAPRALIGGSFGPVQGHNPWEAANLGAAILHGPNVANFRADYAQMGAEGAARVVTAAGLAAALQDPVLPAMAERAKALTLAARGGLDPLARQVLDLADG